MARSISIVEYKVEQARFFLEQIPKSNHNFFAVQCFTDAFVSACRSITFSMQSVINTVDGFKTWYAARTDSLTKDPLSQFFNAYRVASIHIGDTVVRGGTRTTDGDGRRKWQYLFIPTPDLPSVPDGDVFSLCKSYFTTLLSLVYDAFWEFRYQLDDRWYYTADHFRGMDKSIKDAEEELGFPPEWTATTSPLPESGRWQALRRTQAAGCQLNNVFQLYLGKTISGPDEIGKQDDTRFGGHADGA